MKVTQLEPLEPPRQKSEIKAAVHARLAWIAVRVAALGLLVSAVAGRTIRTESDSDAVPSWASSHDAYGRQQANSALGKDPAAAFCSHPSSMA